MLVENDVYLEKASKAMINEVRALALFTTSN